MIRRVTVKNFKRFQEQQFELADSIVLAGPNNAGKSTLLQAIATWKRSLDWWMAKRKGGGKTTAAKRSGVSVTRGDFAPVTLREMNLLWEDRRVNSGPGKPRQIEIVVEGEANGKTWSCGLELQYANPELIYIRPRGGRKFKREDILNFPPPGAEAIDIVHIPALSGIERDEHRLDRGMQDLLVGQGRPGDILRNLLWEIADANQEGWQELTEHIQELFNLEILSPSYSPGQPYILCEYREPGRTRPLDLCNAGSGTLQVLLLFAFLYARSATVILLDEPDSHQHVILQKQVYDLIRRVARERGGQVIVATHSEVILDATEPTQVLAFFGGQPRALASQTERDQVREALKRVTTTDLLLGRQVGSLLYVEGETDGRILAEWARIINHPARRFLEWPAVRWLGGRSLKEAKDHFFAMQAAFPNMRGLCLLDGDNRDEPDEETTRAGLIVLRWHRYEIENYLLHPEAIKRFVGLPSLEAEIDEKFGQQVPHNTDLFGDHVALMRMKASTEFLVPLLENIGKRTPKKNLYQLANVMNKYEIHPEIVEKLDRIAEALNPT